MKSALIIFVRNPVSGKVKTRIAKTLGHEKALLIYRELLEHTYQVTRELEIDKYVYYAEPVETGPPGFVMANNEKYHVRQQRGNDLGERMQNAFTELFKKGYAEVCIIGSDCFELSSNIIKEAFNSLADFHVVIGPATDGGYYLLGMRQLISGVFANKEWSSDKVLQHTLEDLERAHLSCCLLPALSDVDTEEDWLNHTRTSPL